MRAQKRKKPSYGVSQFPARGNVSTITINHVFQSNEQPKEAAPTQEPSPSTASVPCALWDAWDGANDRVKLGQGSFGAVYKLEFRTDQGHVRSVAVKEFSLAKHCASELRMLEKRQAASGPGDVEGGNVVELVDARGACIAMSLASGEDLWEWMGRESDGRQRECDTAYLAKGNTAYLAKGNTAIQCIVKGLLFLHTKAKVAHFDVRPENVMIDGDGEAVIIDLGSAVALDDSAKNRTTANRKLEGRSRQYLPGELRPDKPLPVGDDVAETLRRADVYALGLLQWEIWRAFGAPRERALRQSPDTDDGPGDHSNDLIDYTWKDLNKVPWESFKVPGWRHHGDVHVAGRLMVALCLREDRAADLSAEQVLEKVLELARKDCFWKL